MRTQRPAFHWDQLAHPHPQDEGPRPACQGPRMIGVGGSGGAYVAEGHIKRHPQNPTPYDEGSLARPLVTKGAATGGGLLVPYSGGGFQTAQSGGRVAKCQARMRKLRALAPARRTCSMVDAERNIRKHLGQ